MVTSATTLQDRRAAMVLQIEEILQKHYGVDSLPGTIRDAFLQVPRHLFVPGVYMGAVYSDFPIVTKRDRYGLPLSGSLRPSQTALMLIALDLQPGQNVLVVGTGPGYSSALIAEIVGETGSVTSVEIDDEIAARAEAHLARAGFNRVKVIHADGAAGYPPAAPYDRILMMAATDDIQPAWQQQLRPDGVMAVVLDFEGLQMGVALRREPGGTLVSKCSYPMAIINRMLGAAGLKQSSANVGSSGLSLHAHGESAIDGAAAHTVMSDDQQYALLPPVAAHMGQLSFYAMFHRPPAYEFITYSVEEGQLAYGVRDFGWGLYSPTSICLVPYGDERAVHAFGASDVITVLQDLAEAWAAAGSPTVDQYRVRVTPASQTPPAPPENALGIREFKRGAHTYTVWIAPAEQA